MAHAKKYASQGIRLTKDSPPIALPPSPLIALFLPASNPEFTIFAQFYQFLPAVAGIAALTNALDKIHSLPFPCSPQNARSRLKAHASDGKLKVLYHDINSCHRGHLPSILRSHMSYLLVYMSHSITPSSF